MNTESQVEAYIGSLPAAKQGDMRRLHAAILEVLPGCSIRYLDGRNSEGKVVSNPNIGYGSSNLKYADGSSREFYQIGLSANTTGISLYIMGIEDKFYLSKTYGDAIGKANVTSYCIKFKALKDINMEGLLAAIRDGAAV